MNESENKVLQEAVADFAVKIQKLRENDKSPWLTRSQAARLLQVTRTTIINYERLGLLRPIKIAGKRLTRYHIDDINNLLVSKW